MSSIQGRNRRARVRTLRFDGEPPTRIPAPLLAGSRAGRDLILYEGITMKHALHDAAELRCRGTRPRISIASMSLALIFGLLCSMQVAAQQSGNFFFTGFLTFNQGGVIHEVTFENYGPWGQNVPIPGYSRDENPDSGTTGLFHLSCSDPLIGGTATVVAWATVAGQPGLTEPPYAINSSVTITDFEVERRREGASGVARCAPERPEVGKTADGSFDREYDWKIEKSATPTSADIFFGDSQEFAWTVTVQPDGSTPKNHAVAGQITVRNVLADPITVTAVNDDFPGGSDISIDCAPALPAVLQPASADLTPQLVCSYSGTSDGTAGTNTATITYTRGDAAGLSASASDDFDFSGEPANVINGTVNVNDSFDGADPAESLGSCSVATPCTGENAFSYSRTLECSDFGITESGGSDSKLNTATIVETEDSDGASVALTCWAPDVSKTAVPAFEREWFWTVDKTLDTEEPIVLQEGQAFELSYTIEVDLADPASADSEFAVSGKITVSNPAPIAAKINSVADAIGELAVDVDCGDGVEFPLYLAAAGEAGDSLVCSYSTGLEDNTGGTNTATATLQNFERKADGDEASGTTDFSGTADFDFTGSPTSTVNACVDVIDLFSVEGIDFDIELLLQEGLDPDNATVCYDNDPLPLEFTYTTFGFMDGENPLPWFAEGDSQEAPPVCDLEVDNEAQVIAFNRDPEAELVTLDSSSVATTLTNAACGPAGCTLTIGYWKTHSAYGPAPYDETWALIGSADPAWLALAALGLPGECDPEAAQCGEDTEFFTSGQTWFDVFWTPPAGGNVFYRLAHQYMAATLNVLNGAAIPAHVGEAWDAATELFGRCGPDDFQQARRGRFGTPAGDCADDAADAGKYASLLDSYNNGYEGVLHCSEDSHSDNDD